MNCTIAIVELLMLIGRKLEAKNKRENPDAMYIFFPVIFSSLALSLKVNLGVLQYSLYISSTVHFASITSQIESNNVQLFSTLTSY